MQKKALIILMASLFLATAAIPHVYAQPPAIILTPASGSVGSLVTVNGSGFAPDTVVYTTWNMSIMGDFIGIGNGETTEFRMFFGMGYIIPDSEQIYVNTTLQTKDVDYTIDYYAGVITFTVPPPAGMLQAVVITADYDIMIFLAVSTTDGSGAFTATFTIPESYAGSHDVWAVSNETTPEVATASYDVEPKIVLSSTKGPPEAWITVTGTGYAPNEYVEIYGWLPGHPTGGFYEETITYVTTDAYGTFAEAIALPSSLNVFDALMSVGNPAVPIAIWAEDDSGNLDIDFYIAVLWCGSEPSKIDVDVEVGELYFPGEVVTVYALTSVDGMPTDVETIEFSIYDETLGPMLVSQLFSIVHVDTGLYAVTSTLPGDLNLGNYLFEVKANKTSYWYNEQVDYLWWEQWLTYFHTVDPDVAAAWEEFGYEYEGYWPVSIHGVGIEGSVISPTLMGMNATLAGIEGNIATINTNIGLIQVNLTAIDGRLTSVQDDLLIIDSTLGEIEAKLDDINATLVGLDETVATINTIIGTIRTDVSSINLAVTSIEDDIATIDTTLGTIQGEITSIEGDTATIETDVGEVKADISNIKGSQGALSTPLYIATILSLISTAGVIILLLLMRQRKA